MYNMPTGSVAAVSAAVLPLAFVWSIPAIVNKVLLKTLSSRVILVISGVLSFCWVAAYALVQGWSNDLRSEFSALKWSHVGGLALVTGTCVFMANQYYLHLLQHYDSHMVSALLSTIPLFTLVLAMIFLGERVQSWTHGVGIVLIVSGSILLSV